VSRRRIVTLAAAAVCCVAFTFFAAFDVRRLVVGPSDGWDVAVLVWDAGVAVAYGWWFVTRLLRSRANNRPSGSPTAPLPASTYAGPDQEARISAALTGQDQAGEGR
jgi:hypothetical protein